MNVHTGGQVAITRTVVTAGHPVEATMSRAQFDRLQRRRQAAARRHMVAEMQVSVAGARGVKFLEQSMPAGAVREHLHNTRVNQLRPFNRAFHLAYGFLKGRQYHEMEFICHESPQWDVVDRLVNQFAKRFGDPREIMQRYAAWKDEARGVL